MRGAREVASERGERGANESNRRTKRGIKWKFRFSPAPFRSRISFSISIFHTSALKERKTVAQFEIHLMFMSELLAIQTDRYSHFISIIKQFSLDNFCPAALHIHYYVVFI